MSPTTLLMKQKIEDALKSLPKTGSCYTEYSEVMKEVLDTYENDMKKCRDDETEQLETLSNQEQEIRDTTTQSLDEVCDILNQCKAESENIKFFDCVDNEGDRNVRAIWKASQDSSETAAYIRNQIVTIKAEAEKCNNTAERVYIVGLNKATNDLIACNGYGGKVEV